LTTLRKGAAIKAVLLFALAWQFLPEKIRLKVPDGYDAALLIPVILLATLFAYEISAPLEMLLFNGNIIGFHNFNTGLDHSAQRRCHKISGINRAHNSQWNSE
jgi:ABC-type uncharacterized transport system permease subunit